jgi:hypothetical protein
MANESTKQQIKDFVEKAIARRQNPNDRERIRRKRMEKAPKVAKSFGL